MLGRQLNRAHPLGNPVGFWYMPEGSGNKVFDLSGNGNTGTFNGDLSWCAGKYGSAVNFPGVTDYITIPDNPLLRFNSATQDFTIVAIVNKTVGGQNSYIFDKRDGDNDGWRMVDVSGVLYCSINGIDIIGSTNIEDGKTHLVACVFDRSGNGQIYVDGIPDGNPVDISGNAMDTSIPLHIGTTAYDNIANEWVGQIEAISIYNHALTADEVALLPQEPFCMFAEDDIELMAAGVPAPTGGQIIMIQMTVCPVIIFFVIYIRQKYRKA